MVRSITEGVSTVVMVRIHLTLCFSEAGDIARSWGKTLRGGFGAALREVSCPFHRESCDSCLIARNCAYGYLFETPIQETDAIMRKYPQAPHPFVFEAAEDMPATVVAGDRVSFAMVLIGQAVNYLPHILLAFNLLGEKGLGRDRIPFHVSAIHDEVGIPVYDLSRGKIIGAPSLRTFPLVPGPSRRAEFRIHFETPARIQHQGDLLRRPDLSALTENLRRRLFLLRYFHGDGQQETLSPAFTAAAKDAEIVETSFSWRIASRKSTRQQQEIPMDGVLGYIHCRGDLGCLAPLFTAGEYTHLGKNATFGLGKIRLEELPYECL